MGSRALGIFQLLWALGIFQLLWALGINRVKVMETRRAKYRSEHNVIPIQIRTDIVTAHLIKPFKGTLAREK